MASGHLVTSFFLIFAGAAVLATAALYTRQPLIVAYVAVGAILGPSGLGWVGDPAFLAEIAEIGIIFLLFLLGLDMQPSKLVRTLRETLLVGLASSASFALLGYGAGRLFGFDHLDAALIGAALMFSSTIIGIKLLPTTVLHHRHTGEVVVGLLLLQDLIAILLLLLIAGQSTADVLDSPPPAWLPFLALPVLVAGCFAFVRWVLLPLLRRFDVFHEFVFLLAVGWCLAVAEAAARAGLSLEIGAFVAGVALATSPISQYIAESLRPLRDFFLVLFFFTVGAGFELGLLGTVALPTLFLTALVLGAKPAIFRLLLHRFEEQNVLAWEVGFRLGQISEFSLLVAYLAEEAGLLGARASTLIQATAIATFLLSSYLVVLRYPTPIAVSARLRRN
ncbi:MAG: cation:proton antiporter [Pseudomonadales bacterium]|jgi:Kef-type K+ transport system membrane component KefB|nr:cation:proton antiporter [Pseudomonadales bacterium]